MVYFLCVLIFLVFAAYVTVAVSCVRTLVMIWKNADTMTSLFVALTYFITRRPLPSYLLSDFRALDAKVSGSYAFAGSPLILSIAISGVVAMMPAMGQTPELGAVWQLMIAILIALEFLILYLLYNGITTAVSCQLAIPLALPLDVSENSTDPRNYYEVEPPHPRFLA